MVNDADKELFIKVADMEQHADDILAGYAYTWEVDAIAKYREQAAKDERKQIVAWLRDVSWPYRDDALIAAIEAGNI